MMISERDINYIKALKQSDESVDDFCERIHAACKIIKERGAKAERMQKFTEMMQDAVGVVNASGMQIQHDEHSIKVEFYL